MYVILSIILIVKKNKVFSKISLSKLKHRLRLELNNKNKKKYITTRTDLSCSIETPQDIKNDIIREISIKLISFF